MISVILSYGMGVESTAILLRWVWEPHTRPCSLEDLIVVTSQVGDEYRDTGRDVTNHVLPLMRSMEFDMYRSPDADTWRQTESRYWMIRDNPSACFSMVITSSPMN